MPITYPLTLPSVFAIASIRWISYDVVALSESPFTLQCQVQEFAGQRLSGELTLPPLKREKAAEIIAFLLKLRGRLGTFLLGDPAGATPRGVATGAPLVNGANQTGNQLIIDGCTPSVTNWLRAGDWIQLGTGAASRLHQNLDDVNSDALGQATLTIWPSLRASPPDNDPLTLTNTRGVFRLASGVPWDIDNAEIFGLSVPFVERV